jgi:hypothetical protein
MRIADGLRNDEHEVDAYLIDLVAIGFSIERLAEIASPHPRNRANSQRCIALVSTYSSSPYRPRSRPMPDCL